jgi:hypothetical protein
MQYSKRLKIMATPAFAFLEPDGKLIFKAAGVQTAQDLKQYDHFIFHGAYRSQTFSQYLASPKP